MRNPIHSVMKHDFSRVPKANIPRSAFNRTSGLKTTFDTDFLYPIFVDEALPGDTFKLSMTALTRLATPIFPIMDNIHLDTFFFAVPIRLIWDNFQKFNGEQTNPGDSTDYVVPTMTAPASGGYTAGDTLADYFGIPTAVNSLEHSSLWHRAYNLIYNEWFRDQNLIDSAVVDVDDGPDNQSDYPLRKRGKRHDYFTSCLPWPQKGDSVSVPLGAEAPVLYDDSALTYGQLRDASDNSLVSGSLDAGTGGQHGRLVSGVTPDDTFYDPNGTLYTDLSTATASTINQLRQAFQLQRMYERDARGGSRYTEIIKSHFGVTSPDFRLQRPEYLGGGHSMVNITAVPQTSSTDATTPQGNLSAYGVDVINGHGFNKSFTEHCVIIGLVNARADLTYQQGLDRMFSRSTRFDFYWPALSHIGEQAVLNKEIYAQGTAADDNVFGYQERYAEYRYKPSKVTGKMRSTAVGSLDSWHCSQHFGSLPVLNQSFIEESVPLNRCVAVPSEPKFIFDAHFDLKCVRPMPTYSVPGLIDHF